MRGGRAKKERELRHSTVDRVRDLHLYNFKAHHQSDGKRGEKKKEKERKQSRRTGSPRRTSPTDQAVDEVEEQRVGRGDETCELG